MIQLRDIDVLLIYWFCSFTDINDLLFSKPPIFKYVLKEKKLEIKPGTLVPKTNAFVEIKCKLFPCLYFFQFYRMCR